MVRNPSFRVRQSAILAFAINFAFTSTAFSLPQGPVIANGQVAINQPDPGVMNIKASNGAIINWKQFSIGAGEVTRFLQPSASSAVLNRVVGQNASQLLGQLQANGRVFLINPNGIVIGAGARIDTNGFIASTLDIADADFLAGKLKFFATGTAGNITNQGLISVGPGGRIALIAPNIENSGIIQAPGGKILLAAGRKIEITSMDFEGVSFEIQAPSDSVLNLGKLLADNGAVQVFAGTLRHSGEIRANRLVQDGDGTIRLVGSNEVTLTADSVTRADGVAGGTISIQSPLGTTRVAGTVSAHGSAGQGGDIRVLGQRVAIDSSGHLDASGATGGGQILVGGDFQGKNPDVQNAGRVFVGDGATLSANATDKGDGGRVIVWSDENTRYFGSLAVRGGPQGGNGGFAEVSGKQNLQFAGSADLAAPAGSTGFLLLDPLDIIVSATGGILPIVTDQFADFPTNILTISANGLNILGGNVILQANRNIYFNSATNFTGSSLTVAANGNTNTNGSVILNQTLSTSGGSLDLSGYTVTGSGAISTPGAVNIHVTSGLAYSGAINAGAATLTSSGGNVSNANVTAGSIITTGQSGIYNGNFHASGQVSLNATTGSIYGNSITAGNVVLNAPSTIYNNYLSAGRVDATSASSYVDLYNLGSQPLMLGTINGNSGVYLHSTAGMQQVAGGLITAPWVYLYGQNSVFSLGSAAAPLQIAAQNLNLQNLAAPAYLGLVGNPTLDSFSLQGNLAGVAATSLSGAANMATLGLSAGTGVLNANLVSTAGFGSGFALNVSDAKINATALNMPGAAVSLTGGGGVDLGTVNTGSLTVSAKGPITGAALTTTTGGVSLTTNKCTFYYVLCTDNSPITIGSVVSAGGVSIDNNDNGNIGVTSLMAAGSVNVQAGSYYYSYVDYSYHRTTNAINIGSASGSGVSLYDYGTGDIAVTGNLTGSSSSMTVNAQKGAVSVGGTSTAGNAVSFNAGNGPLTLGALSTGNGSINATATGNIAFQSLNAGGSSQSVTVNSSAGTIKTTADNTGTDISATGNVTLSASGSIGDSAFANPLDILAGSTSTVSLTSSGGSIGALGKPVTIDTNGAIVASAGEQFHLAVQDTAATAKAVRSVDLSASAAGVGNGGTSVFSAQNLAVNASSDGNTITIGDIVPLATPVFDKFRFAATGTSGLIFGNVNIATGSQFNDVTLSAGNGLTQTTPSSNGIIGGYVNLSGGAGAVTVGNVTTSTTTVGNGINITSSGNVTTGDLSGLDITVSGNNLNLGTVANSGTRRYPNSYYMPRLGYYQYVTEDQPEHVREHQQPDISLHQCG